MSAAVSVSSARPRMLSQVKTGIVDSPLRACFYGVPGVGKTTLASKAPMPLVLSGEDGANQLDVAKTPVPRDWDEALNFVSEIVSEPHEYRSLIIDTVDALEELAIKAVCGRAKKETLADFDGAKGYYALGDQWRLMMKGLEAVRARGMNIIFLAHSHQKTVNDAQIGTFDRFMPKLDARVWGLINNWVELVGFCQFDQALYEGNSKRGERNRAMLTGARVMRTVRGTGFEAKNRWSLPETIPLDWGVLQAAIARGGIAPEGDLRARLNVMLLELGDEEVSRLSAEHLRKNGENLKTLAEAINSVQFRIDEKQGDKKEATK